MFDVLSKEPRKHPPPLVEVDAIQQNSTHIFHKIHLPNDTNEVSRKTVLRTVQRKRDTFPLRSALFPPPWRSFPAFRGDIHHHNPRSLQQYRFSAKTERARWLRPLFENAK